MASLFAFLHHVAAFTLFAALVVELILLREQPTLGTARRLLVADMVLGISAGILLVVGLLRVTYFEKGAYYYFHTWTFIAKLSLFVIIALVSVIPTLEFLSWRKAVRQGQAPTVSVERLRSIMHLEIVGIVVIILMAALMAKGVGLML